MASRPKARVEVAKLSDLAAAQTAPVKLSKEQKEEMRDRIAAMRLQGYTFREIATACGISVTVAYDNYKVVEDRWRKSAMASMNDIKARELAKLDLIEQEAWQGYSRSREDKVEINQQFMHEGDARLQTGTRAKRVGQVGDAKWLAIVLDCMDRRAKLLGLTRDEVVGPVRGAVATVNDHNPTIDDRITKYLGVLGFAVGVVEGALAGQQRPGEPVDSERSAPEAGRVLDADVRVREATS